MPGSRVGAASEEVVVSGGEYAHVQDVGGAYGDVRLLYRVAPLRQIFADTIAGRRYPVCELSCANYLTLRARGEDALTALPLFPYRAFRHSLLVVRNDSPLRSLAQLAGTRIGVDDYSMTAVVWVRGLLRSECGIDHRDITWVTPQRQRFAIPEGARVERVDVDGPEASLEARLLDGRIDALLGFDLADRKRPAGERRLRTLLADPRAAEEDYFRRTGIFPIHHCVVAHNDVLARVPRLPQALMQAYTAAKRRAREQRAASLLPWRDGDWDRDMAAFGGDPMPYGWTQANRRNVATLAGYLHEQGFVAAVPDVDALFLPLAQPALD